MPPGRSLRSIRSYDETTGTMSRGGMEGDAASI